MSRSRFDRLAWAGLLAAALIAAAVAPASAEARRQGQASADERPFGRLPDGLTIELITLKNAHGMTVKVMTYGGIITEVDVPDRHGTLGDVVLGFDTLEAYLKGHPYFGAAVGRVGNRIAQGKFTIDGRAYTLATNNGPNHLHGGFKGFDKVVWSATASATPDTASVTLRYVSTNGEEGYPGNLSVKMTYTVTAVDELRIDYEATTDAATPVNLTNHTYWNLAGQGDVLGHELTIAADRYTPVDGGLIPTGVLAPVKNTPLDFTRPKSIGKDIGRVPGLSGYDHNFVLNSGGTRLALAASAYEPTTGRVLEVLTDQPGLQLYTANNLNGSLVGKRGVAYGPHSAFCLETQHFPDSINHPSFPSVVLRPGEVYRTTTVYRFSAR